ncbi:diguanylate cyclase (GGDEF) domain-containing protein [Amphritea atlantica]|uniref:diguanylate cyclase n=1 Tax=Amphritea atlantica TaxID=355243 RepID=A0A1H9LA78_9GAMM|nr:GGDEF domain-containing protein [Amphritea atlantica]SER08346.1 diguanylate cyclase (GGDEF) domain-containing protein [Amphritea atlantica]
MSKKKLDGIGIGNLLDNIPIPAFIINTQHVITHWNVSLEIASGLSSRDVVGTQDQWRPFYKNKRPTMADLIVAGVNIPELDQFYAAKYHPSDVLPGAFMAEDFFPDIGIGGEWLSFTASPIKDENSEIIGAIETLVVISDRKKAEFELTEREQRYRELSQVDDLTQLYNARHFYNELEHELERSRRYKQPLTLCMLDLDFFKDVNDRFGHPFGDQVLRKLGFLIKSHLRCVDSAYRYGGEEFVIIMPQVEINDAFTAVERLRLELSEVDFRTGSGQVINVSLSAGLVQAQASDNKESLVARADKALYRAKGGGRNRTCY